MAPERKLRAKGYRIYIFDGDVVRLGLNRDLGITDADRVENNRGAAGGVGVSAGGRWGQTDWIAIKRQGKMKCEISDWTFAILKG